MQSNPQGTFVYVVRPDNTVEVRTVTVGATQGDVIALDSGVTPGETARDRRPRPLQAGTKVMVQTALAARRRRQPRRRCRAAHSEPVAPVYLAARRDLAADGGDPARGHRGLSAVAGLGAARGRLSDDPGARPSIRARAPT